MRSWLFSLLSIASTTAQRVNPLYASAERPLEVSGTLKLGRPVQALSLSDVGSSNFVKLPHPRFPGHSVRIKKAKFCDPTVNVYTGYLDVDQGAKHLFFYFFESRNEPDKDDVLLWINGGPGCSSALGLLMELGPCNIDTTGTSVNGTLFNPYSWNTKHNVFFLDQPVGVGFSYADFGETIETTEDAALNAYTFISIFFETFIQFKGRPFHMAGESYAGRYLPVFASYLYDQNKQVSAEGGSVINLKSVLIGNGITDISTLYRGRYEIQCSHGVSLPQPLQDISVCVRMRHALPRCESRMQEDCIDRFDAMDCLAAVSFCDFEITAPFHATGRNVFDVSKPCLGDSLCYTENALIASFLDQSEVRTELGVEVTGAFSACANAVSFGFNRHMDKWAVPTQYYVEGLLERGVPVLIYAGTWDFQCNWVANQLWTEKLQWTGKEAFNAQEMRDWEVDERVAGQWKSAHGLTFLTIYEAGHMVPHDKPVEGLAMLHRWMEGKGF